MSDEILPALDLKDATQADPLLELEGSGRDLWADEHADLYVQRLREPWYPPES